MGLISRVSSRTYRYFLVREKKPTFSTKNGSTNHLQTTIVLEHQLQPKENHQNPRRKIGLPIHRQTRHHCQMRDTGKKLHGVKAHRPKQLVAARTQRRAKTVSRAYGGVISAEALKKRITRAFLIEEQKLVTKITKQSREAAAKAAKEEA